MRLPLLFVSFACWHLLHLYNAFTVVIACSFDSANTCTLATYYCDRIAVTNRATVTITRIITLALSLTLTSDSESCH